MSGSIRRAAGLRLCWLLTLLVPVLSACASPGPPPCPFRGEPTYAPSAGCLAVVHGRVLVVESVYGGVTPPGGKTLEGESAQCAAHRETWEETGLNLLPGELVHVFDTGFHLFYCEIHAASGGVELGPAKEVTNWYWLPLDQFDKVSWRFPGQGELLRRLLITQE